MDTGTGLVHIAPGHGEEDYELGRALRLKIYNRRRDGRFVAEVEHFAGLTAWEANLAKIIATSGSRSWSPSEYAQRTRTRTSL